MLHLICKLGTREAPGWVAAMALIVIASNATYLSLSSQTSGIGTLLLLALIVACIVMTEVTHASGPPVPHRARWSAPVEHPSIGVEVQHLPDGFMPYRQSHARGFQGIRLRAAYPNKMTDDA
jgi:hypothetical protein